MAAKPQSRKEARMGRRAAAARDRFLRDNAIALGVR